MPTVEMVLLYRATVIEHRDVWYQDDGPLSKMLCEEQQESHDSQPEILDTCCACDEAKYEVQGHPLSLFNVIKPYRVAR